MKVSVRFAEIHSPLFHAGKNHGQKFIDGKAGVSLSYDQEAKELLVEYEGRTAHIPSTSVLCYEEANTLVSAVAEAPTKGLSAALPKGKVKAQVSGPHDHVFKGPGHGLKR